MDENRYSALRYQSMIKEQKTAGIPHIKAIGTSLQGVVLPTCEPLVLKVNEQADFILIDVPSCKG